MTKNRLSRSYQTIQEVLSNTTDDHVSEYSAQCSYYTILSFIPFVVLLITLIQYTNILTFLQAKINSGTPETALTAPV